MKLYNVKCIKDNTLVINGSGDSPLWNEAYILTDFISPWDTKNPKKIEFRSLWDSKNLYFYFKVFDNEIYIDTKDNTKQSISKSDRVELFFKIDDKLNPYYCLEIDPTSRILDFIAYPERKFEFDWQWPKNNLLVKSEIKNDFFTVEGSITLTSLHNFKLINNNKIKTGIYRAKYNKNENSQYEPVWISWVNPKTKQPNFHVPQSFGELNLLEL
ncbi:endoxylanase [Seonamhaeicola sp. NFXS20]|uniref:carbohydrate-binding family 9-like protein n=1 Tax=Seonamhaeicola sp. NFXS20 TaxID=2816959 RepID=UPI003B8C6717